MTLPKGLRVFIKMVAMATTTLQTPRFVSLGGEMGLSSVCVLRHADQVLLKRLRSVFGLHACVLNRNDREIEEEERDGEGEIGKGGGACHGG